MVSDRVDDKSEKYLLEPLAEFDKVVYLDDLDIPDKPEWIKKHSIAELCTVVKGPYLEKLVLDGAEKIMYLDPDIAVINELTPLRIYSMIIQFCLLLIL